MKCIICNGKGSINNIQCPSCEGFGQINEQTNEEWFCRLSLEEKAKVLYKFYCDGRNDELQIYVNINVNSFKEWLKQPHRDE